MKIIMLQDYGGRVTGERFFYAGPHDVDPGLGLRLVEHGLAVVELEPDPEPAPAPKASTATKRNKKGGVR